MSAKLHLEILHKKMFVSATTTKKKINSFNQNYFAGAKNVFKH